MKKEKKKLVTCTKTFSFIHWIKVMYLAMCFTLKILIWLCWYGFLTQISKFLCYLNEILLTIENNECNTKWYIPSFTILLQIMDKVFYFNDLLQPWENVTKLYLLTIWVLNYTTDCTFARAKLKKYDRMRAGKNGFHLYAKILS